MMQSKGIQCDNSSVYKQRWHKSEPDDQELCTTCRGVGIDYFSTHRAIFKTRFWSFEHLWGNHQCPLCRLLLSAFDQWYTYDTDRPYGIKGIIRQVDGTNSIFSQGEPLMRLQCIENLDVRNAKLDDRFPEQCVHRLRIDASDSARKWWFRSRSNRKGIDINRVTDWISKCDTSHKPQCSPRFSGSDRVSGMCVIDLAQNCIIYAPPNCRYVALSYVWGNTTQLQLTKASRKAAGKYGFLSARRASIPCSIRDAMTLCRGLAERYLWVDSLCVVQDDLESKMEQINNMDAIYSGATYTIVCAVGENADTGLPGIGETERIVDHHYKEYHGVGLTMKPHSPRLTDGSAQASNWNSRAWTFQEYFLSRRLLVFTKTHCFFRCPCDLQREEFCPGDQLTSAELNSWQDLWTHFHTRRLGNRTKWEIYEQYYNLVSLYFPRQLTKQEDAVNAFAGLMKIFTPRLGRFRWGLPQEFFGPALLWHMESSLRWCRRKEFPSWSWAGWVWDKNHAHKDQYDLKHYDQPGDTYGPFTWYEWEDGKLNPFHGLTCHMEKGQGSKYIQQWKPPARLPEKVLDLVTRVEDPSRLLFVYTFHIVLKSERLRCIPSLKADDDELPQAIYETLDGSKFLTMKANREWWSSQPKEVNFLLVRVRHRIALLLLVEWTNGIAYRISTNFATRSFEGTWETEKGKWLKLGAKRSLVILG